VALANKNARVVWALIAHNEDYRVPAAAWGESTLPTMTTIANFAKSLIVNGPPNASFPATARQGAWGSSLLVSRISYL
jgi:hypothetical protein